MTVRPCEGTSADKSLKRTRFAFNFRVPDYETMVRDLAMWMMEHRELYPHYKCNETGVFHG